MCIASILGGVVELGLKRPEDEAHAAGVTDIRPSPRG